MPYTASGCGISANSLRKNAHRRHDVQRNTFFIPFST
jgi:hypothetical protein